MTNIPTDPEEREALAAEYALGTLDARDAASVLRALPVNTDLRVAVEAWEARLAPLAALVEPQTPPDLWPRIEASLAARPAAPVVPLAAARPAAARPALAAPRPNRLWQGWALGATAVAAGLAAFILTRPPVLPPGLMTVLLADQQQPAWLVQAEGEGLRLAALNDRPVEAGRVRQLWALPVGATVPISLGLVPNDGRYTVAPGLVRPQPGMLIEITLEPPGGSPTGRPTGPILFIGRLLPATAS